MIASYLKRITSAEAKKLENNEIFNQTNDVLDGMLKHKFSAENVSKESGETLSQQNFWDEATRILNELEEKMRNEKENLRVQEEEKKKKEEQKKKATKKYRPIGSRSTAFGTEKSNKSTNEFPTWDLGLSPIPNAPNQLSGMAKLAQQYVREESDPSPKKNKGIF